MVNGGPDGSLVIEGHLDEALGLRPERSPVFLVSCGQCEPGMSVVAAFGRDDLVPARVPSGELYGQVHCLSAGHAEYGAGDVAGHEPGEPFSEQGPLFAYEMVVADVELIETFLEDLYHLRISVAQVEDPAVAVAVDESPGAGSIPDIGAFPPAEDKVDAHAGEEGSLAAGDMCREAINDSLFRINAGKIHSKPSKAFRSRERDFYLKPCQDNTAKPGMWSTPCKVLTLSIPSHQLLGIKIDFTQIALVGTNATYKRQSQRPRPR